MTSTVYQLPVAEEDEPEQEPTSKDASLLVDILLESLAWFPRIRFCVAASLFLLALVGLLWQAHFKNLGIQLQVGWPIWSGLILCLANVAFMRRARAARQTRSQHHALAVLWGQIIVDLLVLTAAIHFLGCLNSFAAFAYLLHIVLACIFFSTRMSLCLTLFVSVLFVGSALAERTGLLASSSIFVYTAQHSVTLELLPFMLHVGSALGIWFAVWYLTSRLAALAWGQHVALAASNRRLVMAGRERVTHMLRTTHELKAPFAAIHANAQLLMRGHCGVLPEAAQSTVARIMQRCSRLSEEIKQMLQLANLQSKGQQDPESTSISLPDCLSQCLTRLRIMAEEHGVEIEEDLLPVSVFSVQDHLRMMFENLISNAIAYSHRGGTVKVTCGPSGTQGAEASVADQGIGIPQAKVPRIFEDYYRTQEAVTHNKSSTGLGLAVVRRIAQKHGLGIQVETEVEKGTTFRIQFPIREQEGC